MIFGWAAMAAASLFAQLARAYLSSTWYEDATGYEEALRQQNVLHAPMLVYFRTDWCPHCRAFDRLLEDPKVRSQISPYVKVRLNPEHGKAEKEIFEGRFGAMGFPALFPKKLDRWWRQDPPRGGVPVVQPDGGDHG
jgi:glutaredoxin